MWNILVILPVVVVFSIGGALRARRLLAETDKLLGVILLGSTLSTTGAATLAALTAQADYATIRAPFDGVVTDQFQYQGDFATAGNKLLTIADTSTVIVKAPLSIDTALGVHAGDAASVMPDSLPGVTLQGTVNLVGRSADAQSRAVE